MAGLPVPCLQDATLKVIPVLQWKYWSSNANKSSGKTLALGPGQHKIIAVG